MKNLKIQYAVADDSLYNFLYEKNNEIVVEKPSPMFFYVEDENSVRLKKILSPQQVIENKGNSIDVEVKLDADFDMLLGRDKFKDLFEQIDNTDSNVAIGKSKYVYTLLKSNENAFLEDEFGRVRKVEGGYLSKSDAGMNHITDQEFDLSFEPVGEVQYPVVNVVLGYENLKDNKSVVSKINSMEKEKVSKIDRDNDFDLGM